MVGGKDNVCRWNQITDQQIYYKKKNLITLNITWKKATYCLACYSVGGSSCCFYAFFTSGLSCLRLHDFVSYIDYYWKFGNFYFFNADVKRQTHFFLFKKYEKTFAYELNLSQMSTFFIAMVLNETGDAQTP